MKKVTRICISICVLSIYGCDDRSKLNKDMFVCIGSVPENHFIGYMDDLVTKLGYHPSIGRATDDHGLTTTVMRASGITTDIWVQNAIIAPTLNDSKNVGEIVPSHRQFKVSIDGSTTYAQQIETTYKTLKARLTTQGYQVFDDDSRCPK